MTQREKIITLVETAMMAAMAIVLNLLTPFQLWPQGGSITLTMVPIVILAFRRGLIAGVMAGLLTGLILLMLPGAFLAYPVQIILDYPLAFAVLGAAGWARISDISTRSRQVLSIIVALIGAGLLRFLCHFLSGVIFFSEYAPKGQSVYLYSLIYNASYILPEIIISIIVVIILLSSAPKLFGQQR